jgi:hypothetical protein
MFVFKFIHVKFHIIFQRRQMQLFLSNFYSRQITKIGQKAQITQ